MHSGSKMLNLSLKDMPLHAPDYLNWGSTMVIAPHQDDETLGCGGAIALLRRQQQPVSVVFVSDGTMSHPHSRKYPADARRTLREAEARAAVRVLGVEAQQTTFLRWPDTKVPLKSSEDFAEAVCGMRAHISAVGPDTVLVPWRRDPHCDHRASWQIVHAALQQIPKVVRVVEYPVWVWELAQPGDMPRPGEMQAWRLDIAEVLAVKKIAIAAYPSQTTRLIDDHPEGFMLTPEVLAHFTKPYEVYLEPNQDATP